MRLDYEKHGTIAVQFMGLQIGNWITKPSWSVSSLPKQDSNIFCYSTAKHEWIQVTSGLESRGNWNCGIVKEDITSIKTRLIGLQGRMLGSVSPGYSQPFIASCARCCASCGPLRLRTLSLQRGLRCGCELFGVVRAYGLTRETFRSLTASCKHAQRSVCRSIARQQSN
jgi:hypothetical protein